VFALASTLLVTLAQGVRIDRPPPGTLRRGYIGLDSPRAPSIVLAITLALVVAVVATAVVRRLRRR
jgi:hypothetical protein